MVEKAEKVTGGCLCGAVRYEAEVFQHRAFYCHCRMCQRSSGAPAEIAVFVKSGSLRFTKKEPKYYQSSHFGQRGFCSHCGSRLIWTSSQHPDWTNLSVGCLDHPENAVPTSHSSVESQLPWYTFDDGLPRTRTEDDPDVVAAWAAVEQRED